MTRIKPTKAIIKYRSVLKKKHAHFIKMNLTLDDNPRYKPIREADKGVALGLDIAIKGFQNIST